MYSSQFYILLIPTSFSISVAADLVRQTFQFISNFIQRYKL